ncbi:MAG: hypothetical protein RLZZ127_2136 [Planctomycetota bacterium]
MNITVYGSSSARTPVAWLAAARDLGARIAAAGHVLTTGAGRDGCMGAVADGALAAGGRIRGVILRQFLADGVLHPGIPDPLVAEDMRTRKRLLAEGADAFIALPGGPGTWEELWEIAVQRQIGRTRVPLVVVDCDGFYRPFRDQLAAAEAAGLLYGPADEQVRFAADPAAALAVAGGC